MSRCVIVQLQGPSQCPVLLNQLDASWAELSKRNFYLRGYTDRKRTMSFVKACSGWCWCQASSQKNDSECSWVDEVKVSTRQFSRMSEVLDQIWEAVWRMVQNKDQEPVPLTPAFPALATSKTSMGSDVSSGDPSWTTSGVGENVLLDRISNLDKQKFGKHSVMNGLVITANWHLKLNETMFQRRSLKMESFRLLGNKKWVESSL